MNKVEIKSWIVGFAASKKGMKLPGGAVWRRLARILYPGQFEEPSLIRLRLTFHLQNLLASLDVSRRNRERKADDFLRAVAALKPPCVVLLGREAARLLGLVALRFFEPRLVASSLFILIPHPINGFQDGRVYTAIWNALNAARSLGDLSRLARALFMLKDRWNARRSA